MEMDKKILEKNLQITKLQREVDLLTSEKVDLNQKLDDYADEIIRLTLTVGKTHEDFRKHSEQIPMWQINVLKECERFLKVLEPSRKQLLTDLSNVIKFCENKPVEKTIVDGSPE